MTTTAPDADIKLNQYRQNRRALIQELRNAAGFSGLALRTLGDAVHSACEYYGYASSLSHPHLGERPFGKYEKKHFVPTPTVASNLACAMARYAPEPWTRDDPDAALRQVYIYCLFGGLDSDADPAALHKLPTSIQLDRISPSRSASQPKHSAQPASRSDIEVQFATEILRGATLETLPGYLRALADRLEELQQGLSHDHS